ncbi:MAG: hypothetical protein US69_C0007G0060 [candidate division TM6 bacterium GW2011_GWF2_38_10]|nr:MAG: hypothetical protein US69_C0007G0060 [candidate division TM6 bacterium GW2011_GWF2_38_10]
MDNNKKIGKKTIFLHKRNIIIAAIIGSCLVCAIYLVFFKQRGPTPEQLEVIAERERREALEVELAKTMKLANKLSNDIKKMQQSSITGNSSDDMMHAQEALDKALANAQKQEKELNELKRKKDESTSKVLEVPKERVVSPANHTVIEKKDSKDNKSAHDTRRDMTPLTPAEEDGFFDMLNNVLEQAEANNVLRDMLPNGGADASSRSPSHTQNDQANNNIDHEKKQAMKNVLAKKRGDKVVRDDVKMLKDMHKESEEKFARYKEELLKQQIEEEKAKIIESVKKGAKKVLGI